MRLSQVVKKVALPRVELAQLSIDGEKVEPRRERQREVARALHGAIAAEHERLGLLDLPAAHELARPLRVVREHARRDAGDLTLRAGSPSSTWPPKHAREPVEAVVPVVVAGDPEQTRGACPALRASRT